jgi:hypothetical protein
MPMPDPTPTTDSVAVGERKAMPEKAPLKDSSERCPSPGCKVSVDDVQSAHPLADEMAEMGVADCPEHGRWYFEGCS